MSLADQQWCPTSVQVTVLQARGLRIKGKSGTNDAYAVMQVGKEKYQTSVVEKSVAPVWKEEAAFDLPPLLQQGGGGGGGGGRGTERSTLHVQVLHRALVGPDKLLGQAVINLLQLSEDKSRNKTEWFKLLDKTGKADKDRGEVLVDIQFMRNNMTASMFDLSGAGKSRSRLGKFKDKVRGKKKESDAVSTVVPSFTQVLTDSEEDGNGEGEVAACKDEKKKKHKMKSLFSTKSNLQRNMSQSMSVLPAKNSSLSGSQSSGLNVDSSEGKKKFKFMIHKRSGSSDSKDSSSGHQKHGAAEQSNLCINGSHVYCEEPPPRTSRIGSNFSLASSGHGSMEDVPESSPPSVDSLRAVRQYSPWTEEEEEEEETAEVENIKEDVGERRREEEERIRMEEERRRKEEEEERVRREEVERLAVEKRRLEEERRRIEEEEKRQREEERAQEERRRQEEERKLAAEKRRLEEEERRIEEEKVRQEEEERRREKEERAQEESRRQEEEERARRQEEERERLAEEKRRLEEQQRMRIEEEEKRQREEEEKIRKEEEKAQEERRRQEEEERARRKEEERERLAEEKRRLEEQQRMRIEEEEKRQREERIRMEEERAQEERKRQEDEERARRQEERRVEEEKRRLEEEEERRRFEEEKVRKEEEERIRREEEMAQEERRREEEVMEHEKKRKLEEQRQEEEKKRIREEDEKARKEKEEYERLAEEKWKQEEEERKRVEVEEKIRKEERARVEKVRRLKEEEEKVRRQKEEHEKLTEEKRRLEELERRRIEEEEKRQREEEEIIRKEEERKQKEEERARKEKEEHERLVEEQMRQEEQERRRIEEEERIKKEEQEWIRVEEERKRRQEEEEKRIIEEEEKIRREDEAEKERKEEEARKLEKEKLTRDAEEQKKRKNETKHKPAAVKSKVESPAEVTSTNPFDEDFSNNPFEDAAVVSTVQQRNQSAASSKGSKTASTDEKDLISAQRKKLPAPKPPGRNPAERQTQREQDGSTRHLAQINKQSKDKDVKTVSVPPRRSVQMIAPLSRSPKDAKNTQSLTQSSATKGTTNVAKHSKRLALTRPRSVEEGPSSEPKTVLSSGGKECGSEAKQEIVYGLNPFEDDEDENDLTAQDGATTNTGPVQWPPVVSQAANKDASSQAKIKSSKVAHAPPLPGKKAATSGTAINQSTEESHVTDNSVTHPCDPNHLQESPLRESQPVQSPGEEAGGKKEGPPTTSRRLQPVKPLNPLGQQSVSVVQGERDNKSTEILCELQEKTKVNDTELKGPYSQLTREELISLVLKQEKQLSEKDKKISELEQYIDNLLVRVIEEQPSILMSMNSLKKPV